MAYPRVEGVKKRCPPEELGVTTKDLLFDNGAFPAQKGERWLKQIFHGRTVIVHGGKHDLTSFFFDTDAFSKPNGVTVVDTQELYSRLQGYGTPALSTVVLLELGKEIQIGGHSPVQDAETTAELYLHMFPLTEEDAVNISQQISSNQARYCGPTRKELSLEDFIKPSKQKKQKAVRTAVA